MRILGGFILALMLSSNLFAIDNHAIYVSPGFSISWNLEGNLSFSPKISFGYYQDQTFTNLTVGYSPMNKGTLTSFWFVEGQVGHLSDPMEFRKLQLFSGAGLGINIHPQEDFRISYRASLFSGFGIFAKASFIYKDRLIPDLGAEAVMPLPLNNVVEIGSPGGGE
ncbi:MAG: hypothetical protein Kow0037_27710 [Calditrichia bacterium]